MDHEPEIAVLGASSVGTSGAPVWQPQVPVTDDDQDTDGYGQCQVFQALGVTSMPYGKDASGYAECLIMRGVGGRDAVCVGARDTRTARIAGRLLPGDTVLHSTGPALAAQVQLKEVKRVAALLSLNGDGETMAVVIDGANGKLQITAQGAIIEIARDGSISFTEAGGAAILMSGGQINLIGKVVLGGGTADPSRCIMLGPATGSPGGPASVPLVPAMGVFVGL